MILPKLDEHFERGSLRGLFHQFGQLPQPIRRSPPPGSKLPSAFPRVIADGDTIQKLVANQLDSSQAILTEIEGAWYYLAAFLAQAA